MRDQLLLPGRTRAAPRRCRSPARRNAALPEWPPNLASRWLRRQPTRWRPRSAPPRSSDRPPRLFGLVLRHHTVGLSGSVGLVLRQFGFLDLGLLFGELEAKPRKHRSRGPAAGRSLHGAPVRGRLDRRCAKRVIGFFGLQMHNRQRRAANVERERDHRGRNPEPPGWLLLVEAGQGFAGAAACDAAPSGTPSSATSLIFE